MEQVHPKQPEALGMAAAAATPASLAQAQAPKPVGKKVHASKTSSGEACPAKRVRLTNEMA